MMHIMHRRCGRRRRSMVRLPKRHFTEIPSLAIRPQFCTLHSHSWPETYSPNLNLQFPATEQRTKVRNAYIFGKIGLALLSDISTSSLCCLCLWKLFNVIAWARQDWMRSSVIFDLQLFFASSKMVMVMVVVIFYRDREWDNLVAERCLVVKWILLMNLDLNARNFSLLICDPVYGFRDFSYRWVHSTSIAIIFFFYYDFSTSWNLSFILVITAFVPKLIIWRIINLHKSNSI